jgi:hypothetical protein
MTSVDVQERRSSPRRRLGVLATIKLGVGLAPRCCLISNISEEGVCLQLNGIDVIDEFVLLFANNGPGRDGTYKVAWRNGREVGAKFISPATRND